MKRIMNTKAVLKEYKAVVVGVSAGIDLTMTK